MAGFFCMVGGKNAEKTAPEETGFSPPKMEETGKKHPRWDESPKKTQEFSTKQTWTDENTEIGLLLPYVKRVKRTVSIDAIRCYVMFVI